MCDDIVQKVVAFVRVESRSAYRDSVHVSPDSSPLQKAKVEHSEAVVSRSMADISYNLVYENMNACLEMHLKSCCFDSYSYCFDSDMPCAGIVLLASSRVKNTDPIGKCCITGNFPNTSALYIFIIP